jgi:hypothetical protein
MAKRNAIKVDINEMFLPNTMMDDENLRKELISSPLWPIVVAIYGAAECKVRVSDFGFADKHKVCLSTEHGFPIANAIYDPTPAEQRSDNAYAFVIYANNNLFTSTRYLPNGSAALYTESQRYAVQKISRGPHDVRSAILNSIAHLQKSLGELVRPIIDHVVDRSYGSSLTGRPTFSIPNSLTHVMLNVFMNNMDRSEVPLKHMSEVQSFYETYKTKQQKFDDALNIARSLFQGEKIIFFPNVREGVIVGKTNMLPALAAIDEYHKGEWLPQTGTFAYMPEVGFSVPLRWYQSIHHIPQDLRKELEIQLVMLKAHTNSDQLVPSDRCLVEKRFWPEIGASCEPGHGVNSSMFILNTFNVA